MDPSRCNTTLSGHARIPVLHSNEDYDFWRRALKDFLCSKGLWLVLKNKIKVKTIPVLLSSFALKQASRKKGGRVGDHRSVPLYRGNPTYLG